MKREGRTFGKNQFVGDVGKLPLYEKIIAGAKDNRNFSKNYLLSNNVSGRTRMREGKHGELNGFYYKIEKYTYQENSATMSLASEIQIKIFTCDFLELTCLGMYTVFT